MYENLYFNIKGYNNEFKASKKEMSEGWCLKFVGYLKKKKKKKTPSKTKDMHTNNSVTFPSG
jgi:hypothetical protein